VDECKPLIIGYMHFWGLSIDSITVIMLVIALGLAVDYSAHIGRSFMVGWCRSTL
jgi:predicted RND superfamily exporter protein